MGAQLNEWATLNTHWLDGAGSPHTWILAEGQRREETEQKSQRC